MSWTPPPPSDGEPSADGWPPPPTPAVPQPAPPQPQPGVPGSPGFPGAGAAASPGGWGPSQVIPPPVGDGLVSALKVLVVLQAVALLVLSAVRLLYARQLDAGATAAEIETVEIVVGLLVIAWLLLIGIPAVVVWCRWQLRTHRRVAALRPQSAFRHSGGFGVGAWFVPIANLFVPARAVADLWRNSAPPGAPGPDPTPPTVAWWWGAFVIVPVALLAVAFAIGFAMAAGGATVSEAEILGLDAVIGLLQSVAVAVAAWFAVQLVGGIHARLRALESAADAGRL